MWDIQEKALYTKNKCYLLLLNMIYLRPQSFVWHNEAKANIPQSWENEAQLQYARSKNITASASKDKLNTKLEQKSFWNLNGDEERGQDQRHAEARTKAVQGPPPQRAFESLLGRGTACLQSHPYCLHLVHFISSTKRILLIIFMSNQRREHYWKMFNHIEMKTYREEISFAGVPTLGGVSFSSNCIHSIVFDLCLWWDTQYIHLHARCICVQIHTEVHVCMCIYLCMYRCVYTFVNCPLDTCIKFLFIVFFITTYFRQIHNF